MARPKHIVFCSKYHNLRDRFAYLGDPHIRKQGRPYGWVALYCYRLKANFNSIEPCFFSSSAALSILVVAAAKPLYVHWYAYGFANIRSCALHALTALFEAAQSGFGVAFLATLHFV
jgi:hypothetical protein